MPGWKQGGDGVNIETVPAPQNEQFRRPQAGIGKSMCRVNAERRVKVGVACQLKYSRTYEEAWVMYVQRVKEDQECVCVCRISMSFFFKKPAWLVRAAVAEAQCEPLFAGGWWCLGNDHAKRHLGVVT